MKLCYFKVITDRIIYDTENGSNFYSKIDAPLEFRIQSDAGDAADVVADGKREKPLNWHVNAVLVTSII